MTAPYLLPLADLHAAAPGAVGAIAHFDGDFPEAPIFHPPLWDGSGWVWDYDWSEAHARGLALDLRVPTVAARLAGLCLRAADDATVPELWPSYWEARDLWAPLRDNWTPANASALAALTLALATRIAALRGGA